jgi:hypothetical protein
MIEETLNSLFQRTCHQPGTRIDSSGDMSDTFLSDTDEITEQGADVDF